MNRVGQITRVRTTSGHINRTVVAKPNPIALVIRAIRKHLIDAILVAPLLWVGVSMIDVVMHQSSGGTPHAWNLIVIAINIGEALGII